MAAGGIGTVGTLIYMIAESKKHSKQIDIVQKIQSQQLESLYEPDIRLASWTINANDLKNEIVISNHGEDLLISSINNSATAGILDNDSMMGWFPYNFDNDNQIHIPLSTQVNSSKSYIFDIVCSNKLGLTYSVSIHIIDGKPKIGRPSLK